TLSGRSYTIVGVMPPTFQFPPDAEGNKFWLPHAFTAAESDSAMRNARDWLVLGRLSEGVSLQQARALLETVAHRREQDHPEANRKWTIEAKPTRTLFVGPTLERTLWSLQAAVLMLLLISCANVGYRHALPSAAFLSWTNREFFRPDLDLIHSLASTTTFSEVKAEASFIRHDQRMQSGFLRGTLRIRISGRRLADLAWQHPLGIGVRASVAFFPQGNELRNMIAG